MPTLLRPTPGLRPAVRRPGCAPQVFGRPDAEDEAALKKQLQVGQQRRLGLNDCHLEVPCVLAVALGHARGTLHHARGR